MARHASPLLDPDSSRKACDSGSQAVIEMSWPGCSIELECQTPPPLQPPSGGFLFQAGQAGSTVQTLLHKLVTHAWLVAMFSVAYLIALGGCWARTRRDEKRRGDRQRGIDQGHPDSAPIVEACHGREVN